MLLLQRKINRYVGFIETGELAEVYPSRKRKPPVETVAVFPCTTGNSQSPDSFPRYRM